MQSLGGKDSAPAAEKIQEQLQRILASPEFHATDRQREFVQFIVSETIAGRAQEIKAYTVATRVFGRGEDFDQARDPIVSIQANRVRRALERYYLVAGRQDPVRIDIPKGSYVPTFHERTDAESDRTAGGLEGAGIRFDGSWPSVLVRPFHNLTGDPEMNYLGIGLAIELAVELARFQEIKVLLYGQEGHDTMASDGTTRFAIDGNIRKDREGIKVAVHLTDTKTNRQIWGDMHRSDLDAARLISFQEDVSRVVAVKASGEQGVICRTLSKESRNKPPAELKTYEAVLRYYEYDQTLTQESFWRALDSLTHASRIEPDCGQVWTMLGRLYANIYSLDISGFERPLETAAEFAERGVQLDPDNQRSRGVLALVRMFKNDIPGALADVERALDLNPNSLFNLDGFGYLMTLLGEWERGPALIRKAMRLNPFYSAVVHYALWVDWVRQEQYQKAYLETLHLRRPAVFWDPLAKAATLGQLGRYEEAARAAQDLLRLKPDFPSRGRVLIGYYIKFEDIVERVIDGLCKSGLNVK